MSRHEIWHTDKGIAFGHDHIFGLFLQLWHIPEDPDERKLQRQFGADPDEIIVDMDEQRKDTMDEMIKVAVSHGFSEAEVDFGTNATLKDVYGDIL